MFHGFFKKALVHALKRFNPRPVQAPEPEDASDDAFDPALRPSAKSIAARKEQQEKAEAAKVAEIDAAAKVSQAAVAQKLTTFLEANTGGMIGLANAVGQMAGKAGDSLTVYTSEFKLVGEDKSSTSTTNNHLHMPEKSTPNEQLSHLPTLPSSVSNRRLKGSTNVPT